MAPLQKRALYSLIIGLFLVIALTVVFLMKGVATFDDDLGFRLIVYALWIAVPLVYLIAVDPILQKPKQVDERDKMIVEKATKVQLAAVILSVLAWAIALTEAYWGQGQVPIIFLTLIVISTLSVSTIAQSLGILIGYWREG